MPWYSNVSAGDSPKILVIFDDIFPYRVSGFRLTEYLYHLDNLPQAKVVLTLASLNWLGVADQRDEIIASFPQHNPEHFHRLELIDGLEQLPTADAFYTIQSLIKRPEELAELRNQGMQSFRHTYSTAAQLDSRLQAIRQLLS